MPKPRPRPCPVCLRRPCACPDPADECDEQAAIEEDARIRELLRGFPDAYVLPARRRIRTG